MNPTQEQLQNRLNPTAVNVQTPSNGGLFRATGNLGDAIYAKDPTTGKLISYNLSSLNNGAMYGDRFPVMQNALRSNYGIDYNSLPEVNLGDFIQQLGRSGIGSNNADGALQGYSINGDLNNLRTAQSPATLQTSTINNTPNAIATPQQIQQQMQNPAWNQGAGKQLPDTGVTATGQPIPQDTNQPGVQGAQQATQQGAQVPAPSTILQPGATGADVQKLQNFLVSQGLMTQAQVDTGYGIYGPQTTKAVLALQQKLGIDNKSGPGYFGPKTIEALSKMQKQASTEQAPGTDVPTSQTQGANGATTPEGKTPLQGIVDNFTSAYKQLGGTENTSALNKTIKEQQEMTDKMNGEIDDINNDPWLTEGVRVKRTERIKSRYETKLNTLSNFAKLFQAEDERIRGDAQFITTQLELDQRQAMDIASRRQEALDKLEEGGTPDIKEYNLAQQQGFKGSFLEWQSINANLKARATGAGAGGLTNVQIDNGRAIISSFEGSPIVKNFIEIQSKFMNAQQYTGRGDGATDIATIYDLMRVLDPTSVVRTEEYEVGASKSGNIFAGRLAYLNGLIKPEGGFISQQAKDNIFRVIGDRYTVAKSQYDNLATQKQGQIDQVSPGMKLTDFSGNLVIPSSPQSTLPKDIQDKLTANWTWSPDGKSAYIPRAIWSTFGDHMDAILKEAQADGVTLLIK